MLSSQSANCARLRMASGRCVLVGIVELRNPTLVTARVQICFIAAPAGGPPVTQ